MGSRVWASFVAVFSALGAFLFGLDIGYIAPILECESFKRDVAHLDNWKDPNARIPDATVGFIVGIFSLGCIVTSFPSVSGYFLDVWGRRSSIVLGSGIFLVGCAIQALARSVSTILVGRLVAGLSIGLLSSVVALYQSELAPPSMRGALTSIYQLMITFGILVAAFVDKLLVPHDGGWRWAICLQALPAGALFMVMPHLPRSPRWLVQQGRQDEALAALQAVRDEKEAEEELQQIVESHEAAKALGVPHWMEFYQGRVGRLLALGVSLQLLQQLVGMNAFMYFGPRIFASVGRDVNLYQTLTQLVNFLSSFPAVLVSDRFGRRLLLIWSAVGMTLACLLMGTLGCAFFSKQPDGSWSSKNETVGTLIVVSIFFFVANFAYGWGPIVWVYNSEIFPLRHRSWCVSATACSNWVGNYAIAQFTPVMLGSMGFGTFFIFCGFSFMSLALASWLPETKGVMLEEIDKVFDEKFGVPADARSMGGAGGAAPVAVRYGAVLKADDSQGLVDARA